MSYCSFRSSYTHQVFDSSHNIFRRIKFHFPGLCILLLITRSAGYIQLLLQQLCSYYAAPWAEQPQEVTGVWCNCPCFPLPLPCSIVHCIPLLNLGLPRALHCSLNGPILLQIEWRYRWMSRYQHCIRHRQQPRRKPQSLSGTHCPHQKLTSLQC